MSEQEFYLEREDVEHELGKVCVFTVHGRTKINLVGAEALGSMRAVIEQAAQDDAIRCAILQGKNDQALIGGADLKELGALEQSSADSFVGAIHLVCAAQSPVHLLLGHWTGPVLGTLAAVVPLAALLRRYGR